MSPRRDDTVLVTVLFTDIVGSTEIAGELGDRRWRDLVRAHHAVVRRELKRFRGRELDTAGDGFFARFDRPADAVRCACAISDAVRELGVEIRAGLHLGEAEVLEGKVGGITVNVGARVMGVGMGGEVLVSSTLRDALAGSGFEFADHGLHRLKGIEGEWRLYEVVAVDGARRSLPLTPDEARERRSLTPGRRVVTRGERFALAGGAAAAILLVLAFLTGVLGDDAAPVSSGIRFTRAEEDLRSLVPPDLRSGCRPSHSTIPNATASIECSSGSYRVLYSRFGSAEDMADRFQAFASVVPEPGGDCSHDPVAEHGYTVNGIARGNVACYVDDRASGLTSATSVIVWTDDEFLVLARATRGDAADLTLYEWWRTEAGPLVNDAAPPKDGHAKLLNGRFQVLIEPDEAAAGSLDPSWAGAWTLSLSPKRGFEGMPTYGHSGELLFGKPDALIFDYGGSFKGMGALCPAYQSVRWAAKGEYVTFDHPVGHCRERNLDILTFKPWVRLLG